ncbi:MAG: polysaccharide biosynthesis protein [Alphaproteobacteria bacterium]|nr:polysaccharide biosynthesis protein [Alphaproteobacteria bacterium]
MRLTVLGYDVTMAGLAMYIALILRLGTFDELDNFSFVGPFNGLDDYNLIFGAVLPFVAAAGASLLTLGTYRTSWRHASTADLTNIVKAATLAVLIYTPVCFVVNRLYLIPRTSIVLAWMVFLLLMAGSRIGYRLFREGHLFFDRHPMMPGQVPILIVGSGVEAKVLILSLGRSSQYYPVGVLDDTVDGYLLGGVPVLGKIADVERVVNKFRDAGDRPRKLVVVDRTLPATRLNALVEIANRLGLTIARAPDPTQFRGTSDALELRPISVEDLLGRSQIVLDPGPVHRLFAGRRVLITGAGGSIGSEIVRQVCALGPAAICLIDASEFNLYTIDGQVSERWPAIERVTRVIDVRHRLSIEGCFASFSPEIVFHAAALKHVPLVEANPVEAIWTNAIGTRRVCDAAARVGCRAMVLISTDKAVNPTSVMGASKRCAEGYCQALALAHASRPSATHFMAVRFGNVLGSSGSVVPLFERQLKAGGPLTVTHPEIERYFMTIREAVQLVLQASALGVAHTGLVGRVFALDMGSPVKIADLARQMIRLAGLQPGRDVQIKFTGLRPGEKLFEEVFHTGEQIEPTTVPRVNVASTRTPFDLEVFTLLFDALEQACFLGRERDALRILRRVVPEYEAPSRASPETFPLAASVTLNTSAKAMATVAFSSNFGGTYGQYVQSNFYPGQLELPFLLGFDVASEPQKEKPSA